MDKTEKEFLEKKIRIFELALRDMIDDASISTIEELKKFAEETLIRAEQV